MEDIYEEGRQAHWDRHSRQSNPYSPETEEFKLWESGWCDSYDEEECAEQFVPDWFVNR